VKYFRGSPIKWGGNERQNYNAFVTKLKECERHINKKHDLKKLSRSFTMRVRKLITEKGRRLKW